MLLFDADGRCSGGRVADRVYERDARAGLQRAGHLSRLRRARRRSGVRCDNYYGLLQGLFAGQVTVGVPGPAACGAGLHKRTTEGVDVAG